MDNHKSLNCAMSVKNNQQLIIDALVEKGSLTPSQIAEVTGIGDGTVRTTVRQMVLKGLIVNPTYGQYQAISGRGIPDSENPYTNSGGEAHNKSNDNSLTEEASQDGATRNPKKKEVSKVQAPDNWEGEPIVRVRAPGAYKVKFRGQTIFTIVMSEPDPEWEEDIDITDQIVSFDVEKVPPPKTNNPQSNN